jgi:glycosyltransferase involved in cell wall biosynthesis
LLGLRVVVTHHGPDYDRDKWGPFARWVLRTGERAGMRYANDRIAISQVIADLILSRHKQSAEIIPNGVVPVAPTDDTGFVRQLGLEPRRYVLQVSRMVPEKRQLDLIKAFTLASPAGWKLALVGGLTDDRYCLAVRAAATSDVVLTDFLSGPPLQQVYSHAGAFVLPSSHEGLPIAMLEALSYGLPVLASDIPANLEIGLDPSSHFPLGDVQALAHRLGQITQTAHDEDAYAARRHWVATKYDWDQVAARTLGVYQKCK